MGTGLRARPAVPADEAAVDALLAACGAAYLDNARGAGEAAVRLSRPGSRPALVTDAAGEVVGFGEVWRVGDEARCFARVRPDATGTGVGSALLTHFEAQAADLGADHVNVTQWAADAAGTALLTGRGYRPVQYVLRMTTALADVRDAPPPPGVEFAAFDPDRDRHPLYAAWQAAFADPSVDEAGWWSERATDPTVHFDPALWLLARAHGEIVGFALGRILDDRTHGTVGYIGDVGVRPQWRRRGLALALLSRAFARFAATGQAHAALDVDADNLTGALRLYRAAGMVPVPRTTVWSRPL